MTPGDSRPISNKVHESLSRYTLDFLLAVSIYARLTSRLLARGKGALSEDLIPCLILQNILSQKENDLPKSK
jgi:hypothetical protein